jgi:hypothetical protein
MARVRDNTSVRYLIPSTRRNLTQWQLNAATDQFYELATQETNRPTLDTLISNTLTPKELKKHEPTLIYDSGWKDVT